MTSRRQILASFAAAGGATLALPGALRSAFAAEGPDVVLRLVAAPATVARPPRRASPSPGNLGPTLDLRRGERVRIEVVNSVDT